ncbi:Alpha/Beta hydrolase protein [Coniella lustricola]|uniref:Alpha/Beta hydrolase protein n=1 Tax=Coniella lustricola TaxID=2025994 RepID=A0A2T2ZXM0_9PEZI|nr:Alpha/Beta hydrolase protein [Coniella lustricola]
MDSLTKKTLLTKRGFTYTYYVSPAADPSKPTLLLQHGFPDSAAQWADLITCHLQPAGYGAIAPDMLGYAGTSKPTDPAAYKYSGLTADLLEMLDAEGLDRVISLGHDWGAVSARKLYNLHPERVGGLISILIGYTPETGQAFDLDAINAMSEKALGKGYGMLSYWKFFVAEDGARLLRENADVLFDALHAPQSFSKVFCREGHTRKAIEARGQGFDLARREYATEEMKRTFVERLGRDGFEAPVCWYKSVMSGLQNGEGKAENNVLRVPMLYLPYTGDFLCRPEMMKPVVEAGLVPRLTTVVMEEGAHWGIVEFPEAFGRTVTGWLDENY